MSEDVLVARRRGHRARLALPPAQVSKLDERAHVARALWNLLHQWWTMVAENRRVDLADADAAIKQARKDIDFLAVLPAQAVQAVLKTYFRAWRNRWDGRAEEPAFKSRPGTSQRCSACGFTDQGNREDQARFVCKNPDCGLEANADHNAACNLVHLYRTGHALVPAAGRAVARRARRAKPVTAR